MLSKVSNVYPAISYEISSDRIISSWNLLTNPDNLVQSCRGNAVVDSKKTKGKVIADFHVKSTGRPEAILASAENSKASSNVSGQSAALTATCSSDHIDTEHSKYDTGDKISRQTRLSKSKKLGTINSGALPYEDKMCKNDFNVKGDFARHTKTHDTKRSFQCDVCGGEFVCSGTLKRHKKSHTDERPFQCDECGKTFNKNGNLKEHKRSHTGERPFQCDECDKTFVKKSNLKEHKKIHTGEHPFKCDICDKAFNQKRNLIGHKMIHADERPFQCDECGKAFTQKFHLKEHKMLHTDEAPFKCTECGKGFQRKTHLNNHAFSHSSSPLFKCDACDARFFHKSSLNRHVCTDSEKQSYQANRKPGKISNKRCTTDRSPVQPGPDHHNEKSLKNSHCDANFTSTTLNKHTKPKKPYYEQ